MCKYKVKIFNGSNELDNMQWYKKWIERKKHIILVDVSISSNNIIFVTYTEQEFVG